MGIERRYKTLELKSGKKVQTVIFDDPQYQLLSTFFFADYNSFADWIDQNMLDVIEGRRESVDISGNVCELVIGKETTRVYDTLAEDGKGKWCEVETDAFYELMKEWKEKKI